MMSSYVCFVPISVAFMAASYGPAIGLMFLGKLWWHIIMYTGGYSMLKEVLACPLFMFVIILTLLKYYFARTWAVLGKDY